jgi:hypothetical protein
MYRRVFGRVLMNAERATVDAGPRPANPGAATVAWWCAIATAALVVIQFALAGYGAFGGSFGPHRVLGTVIGLVTLVLLIAVLIARPGGRLIGIAAGLFVLAGPLQPLFAALGSDVSPSLGALHALGGLGVGALAGMLIGALRPVRS